MIWGDWEPADNNTWQHDVLSGQDGDDWIYSSHGHNMIRGGRGHDLVWAFYGRGRIDCGRASTRCALRQAARRYKHVRCERLHPLTRALSRAEPVTRRPLQGGVHVKGSGPVGDDRRVSRRVRGSQTDSRNLNKISGILSGTA